MLNNLLPLILAAGLGFFLIRMLMGIQGIWEEREHGKLKLGR